MGKKRKSTVTMGRRVVMEIWEGDREEKRGYGPVEASKRWRKDTGMW